MPKAKDLRLGISFDEALKRLAQSKPAPKPKGEKSAKKKRSK
jgi:hypothetical protein